MANDDTPRYSASWQHPSEPRTSCGVSANASGVSVWSKWGPSPHEEAGRGASWEEWAETPGRGLPPGGPADLMERIYAVAKALGVPLAEPPKLEPVQSRADLDLPEPTEQERRRIRLLRSLGPGPSG